MFAHLTVIKIIIDMNNILGDSDYDAREIRDILKQKRTTCHHTSKYKKYKRQK
jgi:hypothetical protein